MDTQYVLTRLNQTLGLTDLDSVVTFDVIKQASEIIKNTTVPVFSIYLPYKEEMLVKLNQKNIHHVSDIGVTYLLPDFAPRKLLYVLDIRNAGDQNFSPYNTNVGYIDQMQYGSASGLEALMLGIGAAQVSSMISQYINFNFQYPRMLTIYGTNFATSTYVMEFGFEHATSLATIPQTASETFMTLAELDIQTSLYPALRRFTQLETAYGSFPLNIDSWANASEERKEFLKQLDQTYQMDQKMIVYK